MKRCDPVDTAESADPDLDRSIQRTARELKAMFNSKGIQCFRPVSNRGPFACEANVITTTLREHKKLRELMYVQNLATQQRHLDNCPAFKFITFSRTNFSEVLCEWKWLYFTYLITNIHYFYIYSVFSQESAPKRTP